MNEGEREAQPAAGDEPGLGATPDEGLDAGPFHGDAGEFLVNDSAPLHEALEELAKQCWYSSDVVLAALASPGLQATLAQRLDARLGEGFRTLAVRGDMLMGPLDLLRQLAASLSLDDSLRDSASVDLLLDEILGYVDQAAADGSELVVQVLDAHTLGQETLDMLASLGGPDDDGGAPRLLLWAEADAGATLEGVLAERGLPVTRVVVPDFDKSATRRYLEHSLEEAGYSGSFPFSGTQVTAIHRQAEGDPTRINRLARETLSREAEDERAGRFRLPLPHALAGVGLVAVLAALYLGSRNDEPEQEAPEVVTASAGSTAGADGQRASALNGATEQRADQGGTRPAVQERSGQAEPVELAEAGGEEEARPAEPALAEELPAMTSSSEEGGNSVGQRTDQAEQAEAPATEQAGESKTVAGPANTETEEPAREPLARHHQALRAMPEDHYAIQLMGAFAEDGPRDFVERLGDENLHYFRTRHQGRPWFVVVSAAFPSRAEAERALEALPNEVAQANPWIRKLEDIHGLLED